ncbi:MAG TPA: hypothetical protein VGN99_06605 [Steroidobacteraceae bacterium]|jgi:hypothetical protein|nr:hypothetical protein [Steroidobacteraceae bacterium]
MKLYGTDKRELMTVSRIERDGNRLVIRAKVFGTMPMTATLTPADVRAGLKLLGVSGILFMLTMPFRRSASRPKEQA